MLSTTGHRDVVDKIENEAWVDAFAYAAKLLLTKSG